MNIEELVRRADSVLNERFDSGMEFLQEIVRQPSVQGDERGVQEIVAARLKSLGLEIDIWDISHDELGGHPFFVASRPDYAGSPNVVGVWRGTGGGRSLILNGHVDVVPAGEREKWDADPFSGSIVDGKLFGRGSTDMKGGNVALLLALEAVIHSGIRLRGDVIFESVVEEESGGSGTLATIIRGYRADAALVPEPTNMRLFIRQQGSMWFRVHVPGIGAHAGTRYEGVSALEKAIIVHAAIMDLERIRNKDVKDPLYSNAPIPFPINIGKFNTGNWPSSVPDKAVIEGRIGVAPGEEMNAVRDQLIECVRRISESDPFLSKNPAEVEFFGGRWVPNAVAEDHPFTQLVSQQFSAVYGKKPVVEASPWGTDAGLLGRVGGVPALVIGPGVTRMAHYPNEYIDISEIREAARLFMRVIISWCS